MCKDEDFLKIINQVAADNQQMENDKGRKEVIAEVVIAEFLCRSYRTRLLSLPYPGLSFAPAWAVSCLPFGPLGCSKARRVGMIQPVEV